MWIIHIHEFTSLYHLQFLIYLIKFIVKDFSHLLLSKPWWDRLFNGEMILHNDYDLINIVYYNKSIRIWLLKKAKILAEMYNFQFYYVR